MTIFSRIIDGDAKIPRRDGYAKGCLFPKGMQSFLGKLG